MTSNPNKTIRIAVVIGLLAYVALPWYAVPGASWWQALPQLGGGADGAGIAQALVHGRKWLLLGLVGLVVAVMSIGQSTPRRAAIYLIVGGLVGSIGLAASLWLIGPDGWTFDALRQRWGHMAVSQPAPGAGAWLAVAVNAALAIVGINRVAALARAA